MPNIVKHSYLKGPKVSARAVAHVNYLQYRPGEDREQKRDPDDPSRDPARTLRVAGDEHEQSPGKAAFEFKQALTDRAERGQVVHKFILSPSAKDVDMDKYTQEVMESISQQKGQDLRYAWVAHDNTDNRHAHVVVLGKDAEGHGVRFTKNDYTLMRTYGDRYLEREHGVEMRWDKDIEFQARVHAHNLYLASHEQNLAFLERPHKERSWQTDEDFRHLLNINKNWGESLDGPSREGGLSFGSTWMHDRGRLSEVHDIFQNTANKDLWTDVMNNTQDQGLKDYANKQLETLAEQRQAVIVELQDKTGLSPEKFDDFIRDIQEQFAIENFEIDQVLNPEKYAPQEYEHKDIDTDKIAERDKIELKNGDVISKYDSSDYLDGVRLSLKEGPYSQRIESAEYSKLCSWIGTKEMSGEHCYGQPPLREDREIEYDKPLDLDLAIDRLSLDEINAEISVDAKRLENLLAPPAIEIESPDLAEINEVNREQSISLEDALDSRDSDPDLEKTLEVVDRHDPSEVNTEQLEHSLNDTYEPYQTNYELDEIDDLDLPDELDYEQELGLDDRDQVDFQDHTNDQLEETEPICDIEQNGGEDYQLDDRQEPERDHGDEEHRSRGDR